ncbi:MAG: hypothetical protein WCP25_09860 [Polynucleobacter sp.]
MGYIAENKPDKVVEAVLQTIEKSFTSPKGIEQSVSTKSSAEVISEASEKVYFQIED